MQSDVNQNESDADAAIAAEATTRGNADTALGGRLDVLEADPTTATALAADAVQADVNANEADADTAIALKANIASPTFTGTPAAPTASASTNTTQLATTAYVEAAIAALIDGAPGALNTLNEIAASINDNADVFTAITASIAAVQADVNQNELDSDAAIAANEVHVDNAATLLGIAKDGVNFGTFSGGTVADNQTLKTILQALESAVELRATLAGATFTGNLVVNRDFPDVELKSGGEKRLLFTDAGGGATGAIKNTSSSLDHVCRRRSLRQP